MTAVRRRHLCRYRMSRYWTCRRRGGMERRVVAYAERYLYCHRHVHVNMIRLSKTIRPCSECHTRRRTQLRGLHVQDARARVCVYVCVQINLTLRNNTTYVSKRIFLLYLQCPMPLYFSSSMNVQSYIVCRAWDNNEVGCSHEHLIILYIRNGNETARGWSLRESVRVWEGVGECS